MIKRISTLKKVSIFSSLDETSLYEISSIARERHYKKKDTIFHQTDKGSSLFILGSGLVKISLIDADGKEIILKMIHENDFFGEMSLLDGKFRSATISALEDSKALMIFREDFIRFTQKEPDIILSMISSLSKRLRNTDEKISNLFFLDAYGKVASILLDLAAHSVVIEKKHIVLNLSVSRQELANMAGISRETFTRILNEFQIRKCIKVEGKKIIILDKNILKKETV